MSDPRLPLCPADTAMVSPQAARLLVSCGLRGWLQTKHRENGRPIPAELVALLEAVDVAAKAVPEVNGFPGSRSAAERCIIDGMAVAVDRAAGELGVTPRRVRGLIGEGRLIATKPKGHAHRIARWSLDELIAHRQLHTGEPADG